MQRFAFFVLHGHIGRAIFLEHIVYKHDIGVVKFGQCARFLQETIKSPLKHLLAVFSERPNCCIRFPDGEFSRQVFLDGD